MKYLLPQLFLVVSTICCVYTIPTIQKNDKEGRIIGGAAARAGEFPWQTAIYSRMSDGTYFCGGALISNQWILTAAICVSGGNSFTINLGSNSLSGEDNNRIVVSTSTYVAHPEFNSDTLENNVGLIKLRMPLEFTDYISAIPIASSDINLQIGRKAQISGWGQTSDSDAGYSDKLNFVSLSVIDNEECQNIYGDSIKYHMVCMAGNYNEGTCVGDIGGPLITLTASASYVHIAVATFLSQNGCESTDPSGFTRTDYYHDWIYDVTDNLS